MSAKGLLLHLPLLSGLAAFLVVVGLFWGLPLLHAGSHESASFGGSKSQFFVCSGNRDLQFTWEAEITLKSDQSHSRILPRLPFDMHTTSGPNPGTCTLFVDEAVYVNGERIWAASIQHFVDPPSANGGATVQDEGSPHSVAELTAHPEHVGKNLVRYEVKFRLRPADPGTANFDWKGGPMTVYTIQADGDHDGVPDDVQPLPAVHTGLVAVPLGILAGSTAFFIVRRRQSN